MLYTKRTFPVEYELAEAEVCFLGIPWDSTELGKSVKHGPVFVREALKGLEGFDTENGFDPFGKVKIHDAGDIEVVPGNWGVTETLIMDTIKEMFEESGRVFPVFMGGDHLVTLGILKGLKEKHGKFTVVHFDAHKDLRKDWMGEPGSHITWAYYAVKELGLDVVQIGTRSWSKEEKEFAMENGIKESLEGLEGPVYVTVDLDVFDPGFAPEVGTPEPLGMSPQEFFKEFGRIDFNNVIGLDIVECASDKVNTPAALLGAQIIKKALSYKFKG